MSRDNSARRSGYNNKAFEANFDSIFGSDSERKKRIAKNATIAKTATIAKKNNKGPTYRLKPFEEFKSDIDGSIISDRGQLREHNKRNGVTDARDYSTDYMDRRRNSLHSEEVKAAKIERIEALKHTMRTKGYE